MTQKELHARILRRIHRIYIIKNAFFSLSFRVYALIAGVGGVVSLVSIDDVIANMPTILDISSFSSFTFFALMHTEWTVQTLIVFSILLTLWLVRDLVRKVTLPVFVSRMTARV
jgi:hypothetical protein